MLAAIALVGLLGQSKTRVDDDTFLQVAGAKIHYRVRGTNRSNPYLVILHGGPGFSAHQFYNWGSSLEGTFNVVYMDQRGSGQSDRLPFKNASNPTPDEAKGYTMDRLIRDLDAVKRELRIRRWYVLGHSWGGMLGLEYVAKRPREVMGFVDMDGLLSSPQTQKWIVDCSRSVRDSLGTKDMRRLQATMLINAFDIAKTAATRKSNAYSLAYVLQPELYFADPSHRTPGFLSVVAGLAPYHLKPGDTAFAPGPESALDITENYAERDDTRLLSQIRVPVLAIWGRKDGVVPPSTADVIKDRVSNSKSVIVDGAGHFPFLEKPKETTEAILNWVRNPSR